MLRTALSVFEELPERWGLLYVSGIMAAACAALDDWPQAATLLGVLDSLTERTGGQLFPHQVAELEAIAAAAKGVLGPAMITRTSAGKVIGRADSIAAALWPSAHSAGGPRAGVAGTSARASLTAREREVAQLITDGLTNRQIGARLFIAERTVDTHVGRILAKLGCASRAQVAAKVAASGSSFGEPHTYA